GWIFAVATTIVPASLLAFAYCRIAVRFSIGRPWILASCGVLAFVAMLPFQSITVSDLPGKSLWTIGLGLPPSLTQCVQLLIPLAVGLWFIRSSGKRVLENERLSKAA
ncbi:MAG: hypothetical protein LLG00_13690, partial [Planctomycetaceae bacterium]|nr:hypothetical protein [Planctomycetaceae bacterium]